MGRVRWGRFVYPPPIPHLLSRVRQAWPVQIATRNDPDNGRGDTLGVVRTLDPPQRSGRAALPNNPVATAWLLDSEAFHAEFLALWANLDHDAPVGPHGRLTEVSLHPELERVGRGDTTDLRTRAAQLWASTEPVVADHVARLEVSTPEDWAAGFSEAHLGHWFRLCLAGHLEAIAGVDDPDSLRAGLPDLGWSSVETRRVLFGRELGELAVRLDHQGYGQAVNLSLGHGHKGWLDVDDAITAQRRLTDLDRSGFKSAQHLIAACEQLWAVLDIAVANPHRTLILPATI